MSSSLSSTSSSSTSSIPSIPTPLNGKRKSSSSSSTPAKLKPTKPIGNSHFFQVTKEATQKAIQRWKEEKQQEIKEYNQEEKEEQQSSHSHSKKQKKNKKHKKSLDDRIADEQKSLESLVPLAADRRTLNGDLSFSTTQSARVDFFFAMVRGATRERVYELCQPSWCENAEDTVALMLHSRDARDGKGERLIALYAMLWLRTHKPATYLKNIIQFIGMGYFKDLLQLAVLIEEMRLPPMGSTPREDQQRRNERKEHQNGATSRPSSSHRISTEILEVELLAEFLKADYVALKAHQEKYGIAPPPAAASDESSPTSASSSSSQAPPVEMNDDEEQKESDIAMDAEDVAHDHTSPDDWELVDENRQQPSSQLESKQSNADDSNSPKRKQAKATKVKRIPHLQLSLACKWAPSEGSSFDKKHHFAKRLARLLFPNNSKCFRLYREFLSQARTHLAIVEKLMCEKKFDNIDFEKIPSKAHQLLKKALVKHCGERYNAYIGRVKEGKAKINTTGLMPHELISPYVRCPVTGIDDTIEVAWSTLLASLKAKCQTSGGLKSAIAVIDVSGSMTCPDYIPMNVGLSLGLIVSELAVGPFQHRVITFSEQPQWFSIPQDASLYVQLQSMKSMRWGMSTNLVAVFEMILDVAKSNRVRDEDMPKTLFLFSDMQFNQACSGDSFMQSNAYTSIKRRFEAAGYTMISIVFWNLNGANHSDFPVDLTTPGVALIGGYSAELLKVFLEGKDINPMTIMLETIKNYVAEIEESER